MEQRLNIQQLEPNAYKAMFELEKYLNKTDIEKSLFELIKLRVSQINGCAYCIETHSRTALGHGERPQRIFALSAWKESPLFDEKEKAALKLADEITLISIQGLTEETYKDLRKYFSENIIAQMIMLIGTYNLWNRIAISTHMFVPDNNQ